MVKAPPVDPEDPVRHVTGDRAVSRADVRTEVVRLHQRATQGSRSGSA